MFLLFSTLLANADELYNLDPNHSGVFFRIKHFDIGYTYGYFSDLNGKITINNQPTTIQFSIPLASIDTNNTKRDQHLLGPDFFNAKQFPLITFESTAITPIDADTFSVSGNLSLNGITNPISIELEQTGKGNDPWGNHKVGYETNITLKRSDYGVSHMLNSVSDEVHVMVGLEAIKQ
jgi:polyisoprenoid-binding protein YceI